MEERRCRHGNIKMYKRGTGLEDVKWTSYGSSSVVGFCEHDFELAFSI